MITLKFNRRQALQSLGIVMAGAPLAQAQQRIQVIPDRIPLASVMDELGDVFEFEDAARLKLSKTLFATIAGSERGQFDRMTFSPHYMVNTMKMDLSSTLFGDRMIAPVLVGATPQQKRFHPDGELATIRGASTAKAIVVMSSESSVPITEIAAQSTTPFWYQVSDTNTGKTSEQMQQAIKAGCKAICIALAPGAGSHPPRPDWTRIEQLRKQISVPVLVKGIMTPEDAKAAVQRGIQGIVVSSNRVPAAADQPAAMEVLPSIADEVAEKAVVLVDGSIRWGTDVLKALALGAKAVLVGRPAMWGLAVYGDDGVGAVVQLLQSSLARCMAACGNVDLESVKRTLVKIHGRLAADGNAANFES